MSAFTVKLADLGNGEESFRFPITSQWLANMLEGTDVGAVSGEQSGEVNLRLYRSGDDIVVHGSATATLVVQCSRCLGDVPIEVTADLTMMMSPGNAAAHEEELELDADELGREYYSGDTLVFDPIVRDYLMLELPMQPKCSDPPCPEWAMKHIDTSGGATSDDAEPKVDPRLAPLAALKGKLNN